MFSECLVDAEKGKQIIDQHYQNHIVAENKRTVVLIIPDDEPAILLATFKLMNEFLREFSYDFVILLSSIDLDAYKLHHSISNPFFIYKLSKSDMLAVTRFYSFITAPNIIVPNIKFISSRLPFNQKATDLIGYKDITTENFARYGLLGMHSGGKTNV